MLAIYTRISRDRENQISTEIQKEKGIRLASELNIDYELFEEEKGTSGGKKIEERPQLNKLVSGIHEGTITAVYFYNQDRSSRDELTWFTLANLIIDYDIKLYENGILVNLNDSDTYMLSGFKAMIAADFRRKTSKRIKDVHLKLLQEGKATGKVITYGYKKDENGYIVEDETESHIVKRIFAESLSGKGSLIISEALNNEGIKTSYAKNGEGTYKSFNNHTKVLNEKNKSEIKWSAGTVVQLIKNTWYYGKRTVKGEVYDVPPIVSYDYWLEANEALTNRKKGTGLKTNQYLLRMLIKCKCGCYMYGKVIPKKNENYYRCASKRKSGKSCGILYSINRPHIDELIWRRFFANEELKNLVIKHFEDTDDKQMLLDLNEQLITLNQELKSIENQKDNTITYASKNIITPDELDKQLKRIRNEKKQIEIQILNTENQIQTYNNSIKASDSIAEELDKNSNFTSFNDRKMLIHKYINLIEVDFNNNHYVVRVDFNIHNIDSYYLIIHKRFYYVIEPFTNDIKIVNKFQKKHKGKPIERTDEQFINDVYGTKQSLEVLTITNNILSRITSPV